MINRLTFAFILKQRCSEEQLNEICILQKALSPL